MRDFEERFRLVTEAISELFWIATPDLSRALYVSPSYERIFGRSIESIYSNPRSFADAIHPEDRDRINRNIEERAGASFDNEYRIILPDGTVRWIWDRGHAVRDDAGAVSYYVGVAQDITERKQLETERDEVETRLALATRAASDGIWDWDLRTNVAWWSEAMYTTFGLERDCAPSFEAWSSRIHEDDRERVVASLRRALDSNERSWTDQYRFRLPDGRILDVLDRGQVMLDETGTPVRMVGVLIDMTAQRALQDQLRHAQKTEAIGQLAGGIAHDFNNILQAAVLELSLLQASLENPAKVASHATEIGVAIARAATLTRQLLVFSRREAVRPRVIDLNAKVIDVTRMLRRVIGEDIALHVDLAPGSISIVADPVMVDQILLNLALNARDAMPHGGTLAIATSVADGAACMIVRDTGSGIASDDIPHIFEPFFTTKQAGHGTGLGLAMVHSIVEQHRGRIAVDSDLDRGTTFRIYLPISETPVVAVEEPKLPSRAPGRETILLVEDETLVRRALREVLETAGYRVLEAERGAAALSSWEAAEGRIDLVVTDLVMPDGMSGRELVDRLVARAPALRVIFMTGYGRDLEVGANHEILHKPVTADRLLDVIRSSLDRASPP